MTPIPANTGYVLAQNFAGIVGEIELAVLAEEPKQSHIDLVGVRPGSAVRAALDWDNRSVGDCAHVSLWVLSFQWVRRITTQMTSLSKTKSSCLVKPCVRRESTTYIQRVLGIAYHPAAVRSIAWNSDS